MIDLARMQTVIQRHTGIYFALYAWNKRPEDTAWGVITMDRQADAVWGDEGMREQALEGTVHLFISSLETTAPVAVQAALQELGVSWRLDFCTYEQDTRLLHYGWIWRDWSDSP